MTADSISCRHACRHMPPGVFIGSNAHGEWFADMGCTAAADGRTHTAMSMTVYDVLYCPYCGRMLGSGHDGAAARM